MSDLEHLIENAIEAGKKNGRDGFEEEMNRVHNKQMLEQEKGNITKDGLWDITQYILYVHDHDEI